MGADQSKALAEWSTDDIVKAVASLGHQYAKYEERIREKAIDGKFIADLTHEKTDETLNDLGVTARLQRRVLVKKMLTVRGEKPKPVQGQAAFRRQSSLTPNEKAKLWMRMQAAAEVQKRDNEDLKKIEASLRSQLTI